MSFSNKNNEYYVTCPRLCPTIVTPVKGSTIKQNLQSLFSRQKDEYLRAF